MLDYVGSMQGRRVMIDSLIGILHEPIVVMRRAVREMGEVVGDEFIALPYRTKSLRVLGLVQTLRLSPGPLEADHRGFVPPTEDHPGSPAALGHR